MESQTPSSRHRRGHRWLQFGLRRMLVLTTLFALFLGFSAHQARKRVQSLRTVRQLGGTVFYNNDAPESVNRLLGENWFCRVVAVDLAFTGATDADLERAKDELAQLETISWIRISGTKISDRGARSLADALPRATIYYDAGTPRALKRVRNRIPMSWGEEPWRRPPPTEN